MAKGASNDEQWERILRSALQLLDRRRWSVPDAAAVRGEPATYSLLPVRG